MNGTFIALDDGGLDADDADDGADDANVGGNAYGTNKRTWLGVKFRVDFAVIFEWNSNVGQFRENVMRVAYHFLFLRVGSNIGAF